jgi:hypothetical protein
MTKLEPGEPDRFRTRKRWFFLALAVGSALAVLVVGTLFGVVGDGDSAPTVVPPSVHATPPPPPVATEPAVRATEPAVRAPPIVDAPPAPSADGQSREITTHGPDGSTTKTVVSPDGTVLSTTTTRDASN